MDILKVIGIIVMGLLGVRMVSEMFVLMFQFLDFLKTKESK